MEALANALVDWIINCFNYMVNMARNCYKYEENVKLLERKLRDLTSRAIAIEEEVERKEISGKKKRKIEVENWLEDVKNVKDNFEALSNKVNKKGFCRYPMSGEHVMKIRETISTLLEQSPCLTELVVDNHKNKGEQKLTFESFGKSLEENLGKIKKYLLIDNIKSIGIYGMGGVGKTTLAKHINNHLLKSTNFHVCWLTVSQELSIKKLQDDIARNMGINLSDNDNEEQRAIILSRKLANMKNFVLILDDVWQGFHLEMLGNPLSAGCRLILTTRSLDVCYKMRCERRFEVKTLDANEAWELFKDILGYETTLEADIEKVAREIVKECGGLPLGIVTMAGSMRGVKDSYTWRNALNQLKRLSIGLDEMERDVFPALQWSFNRLNKQHQSCLLCCSLYPEDFTIDREEIIRKFISMDLMEGRDTRKQEYDQGHAILNKLINSCLLERVDNSQVKMHDLIRDMTLRLTSGNNIDMQMPRYMVKSGVGLKAIPSEVEWEEDLDVISLMYNNISEISDHTSPQCHKLSILILQDNYFLKFIANSFFKSINRLKVLDLSRTSIEKLPNSVSDMVHLTTLLLQDCCNLKSLPHLGKLKKLRELNLWRTLVANIPQGLEELVNLKHLDMLRYNVEIAFPKRVFSRFCNLQVLRIPCAIEIKELKELKELEIFEGCLSVLESYEFFMSRHSCCYLSYRICVNDKKQGMPDKSVFYNLDFKEVIFKGCNFGKFSRREEAKIIFLPQDIEELKLENCYGTGTCLEDTIPLNGLDNLFHFEMIRLPEVELLWRLPVAIHCLSNGTFSCLQHLFIKNCDSLEVLFPIQLLHNLKNLQHLLVLQCSQLKKIIAYDNIERCDSTSSGSIFVSLPKLETVRLMDLPQLRSICDGTLACDSIRIIQITHCENLRRLPLYLPITTDGNLSRPITLKKIYAEKTWWESLEWDDPRAKNFLQPTFK